MEDLGTGPDDVIELDLLDAAPSSEVLKESSDDLGRYPDELLEEWESFSLSPAASAEVALLLLIMGTTLGSGSTSCRLPRLANFLCLGASDAGRRALFFDLGGDFFVAGLRGLV